MAGLSETEVSTENDSAITVFSQDLLREIILNMVIYYPSGKLNRSALISLRQVQTSWRDTISRLLYQQKVPLYSLTLNNLSRPLILNELQHETALENFNRFFGDRNDFVKVSLFEDFFRLENYDSFCTTLKTLGNSLVELQLVLPMKAGSFPGILPHVGLPNLQKLSVIFTSQNLQDLQYDSVQSICSSSSNATILLQSLLVQVPNLKEFSVYISRDATLNCPDGFQYLPLPPSIQNLELMCDMLPFELQILQRNVFPRLTELYLELNSVSLPENTMYNIFSKVKDTLTSLSVVAKKFSRENLLVKFPEMKKLKSLTISRINAVLDDDTRQNISSRFPNLSKLCLLMQSPVALQSWAENASRIDTVKELFLSRVRGYTWRPEIVTLLPTPIMLSSILQTMPNVKEMSLFTVDHSAGQLGELFSKLEMLTSLRISVETITDSIETSDWWDSLLTGVSSKIIRGLNLYPNFDEGFEITVNKNIRTPSIRMLRNLESLCLQDNGQATNRAPFLSIWSFKFAFWKMPALQKLDLSGRFQIPPDLATAWKASGRKISPESVIKLPSSD